MDRLSKAKGALIGSALGDTVGLYTEFLTATQARQAYGQRPSFSLVEPATEFFNDSHRCRFETRAWTDDTDQSLLITLSYLRNGALLPDDFANRLRTWCNQGLRCLDRLPFGIGATVGGVVSDANFLSDPSGTAMAHWVRSNCMNAANGSVMRTSPVGVIGLNSTEAETFEYAIRMGAVTHSDPRCAISVAIVSGLIRGMCVGEVQTEADVDALLERAWAHVADAFPKYPLERQEFDKHAFATSLDDLVLSGRQMGYVYKCLGSALWCLRQVLRGKHDFRSAMVELVMYGGDADTNGAVAGALMGAHCGYEGLPSEWRDGLRHGDWYMEKIEALFVVVGLKQGTYDAESDPDTTLDGGKGFLTDEEMGERVRAIMEKIITVQNRRPVAKKTWWQFW